MRKKLVLLLCFSLLIIALAAGCQSSANKPLTEQESATEDNNGMTASERRVMASKLSNIAENVNGVDKATVVVSSIGMTQEGINTNNANNQKLNNNMNNNTVTDDNNVDQRNNNSDMNMNQNQQGQNNYDALVVMIGLNLTNDGENRDKEIKQEVRQQVKASDNRISQVLVTTDPNLMKKLNDVAAGIIEGKPVKSFEKDINDLNQKIKQEQPAF